MLSVCKKWRLVDIFVVLELKVNLMKTQNRKGHMSDRAFKVLILKPSFAFLFPSIFCNKNVLHWIIAEPQLL